MVTVQFVLLVVVPIVFPQYSGVGLLGGLGSGLLVLLWWLFFSRAPWFERLAALFLMAATLVANVRFVHLSLAAQGLGYVLPIPLYCLALVFWAAATRGMPVGARRAWLVVAMLLACVPANLVRVDGVTGYLQMQLAWRWTPTAEERLLAQSRTLPSATKSESASQQAPTIRKPDTSPEPVAASKSPLRKSSDSSEEKAAATSASSAVRPAPEWPGFRGPNRDAVIRNVSIQTDWAAAPPVQMWKRAVGPGWSSFAVDGDLFYTQEQLGENEIVSCYRLSTGAPVWQHRDTTRFWEAAGGAGPRATPTLSHGRVFTLGATGIVNALDAATGAVVWSRNAASDTGAQLPQWGFAGSPLVVGDTVIIAASGRLAAYDAATGKLRWKAETGGGGYSSPQLMTLGGVGQILLLSSSGATSFSPADGKQLWAAPLPGGRIIQPALTPESDIVMTLGGEGGTGAEGVRRIAVTQNSNGWAVEERWASRGLKPNFNDFVLHKGHAYGFDGSILACIDLADGARKWKGGRYGTGQLVLLADEDLLLVLSEEGELVLVKASPAQFTEVAKFPALEGKTWNHPVLVGNVVLIRNDREMAAFRLTLAGTQ